MWADLSHNSRPIKCFAWSDHIVSYYIVRYAKWQLCVSVWMQYFYRILANRIVFYGVSSPKTGGEMLRSLCGLLDLPINLWNFQTWKFHHALLVSQAFRSTQQQCQLFEETLWPSLCTTTFQLQLWRLQILKITRSWKWYYSQWKFFVALGLCQTGGSKPKPGVHPMLQRRTATAWRLIVKLSMCAVDVPCAI